jgi:hypothetical protein
MEAMRPETWNPVVEGSQTEPTILFQFDREAWTPTVIFYNGATDTETARLQEIADMMLKVLPDREVEHLEDPEL